MRTPTTKQQAPYITHICDGLYLGNWTSSKTRILRLHNIHVVISVGANPASSFAKGIAYYSMDLLDNDTEKNLIYFKNTVLVDVLPRIHDTISTKKQNILIHCYAGKSRSATIVAAYLIKYKGMTDKQALDFINEKRPISPNNGFLTILKQLKLESLVNKC